MAAFDDCTAAVDAEEGAKVAAQMQAREISRQKFHDAQREKSGACGACCVPMMRWHQHALSAIATDRALAQRMANEHRR